MRTSLALAVAQPLTMPHQLAVNVAAHVELVRAARARVVVFPELSLTGYEYDAEPVSPGDPRLAPLVEACADTGALALAGAPAGGEGGEVSISTIAITGEGAAVVYRKQWLGGEEPRHFRSGPAPAVVVVDGWRLGLAICKDTGIPQHAADTAALGMDVYVASVLENRSDAHIQDERARRVAAEHRVWVAVASYAGSAGEGFTEAAGLSAIWSPEGEVIARASADAGAFAGVTLSRTTNNR